MGCRRRPPAADRRRLLDRRTRTSSSSSTARPSRRSSTRTTASASRARRSAPSAGSRRGGTSTMSVQYLDSEVESQNPATNGKRLALAPEVSGNLWTTVRLPHNIRVGGGAPLYRRRLHQHGQHHRNSRLHRRRRARGSACRAAAALRLNVYNLTDSVYIRSINNNARPLQPRHAAVVPADVSDQFLTIAMADEGNVVGCSRLAASASRLAARRTAD